MQPVECLDANVVQDLMSGALDEAMRANVLGHLDTCDDCRELIGVTAQVELHDAIHETKPYPDQLVGPRDQLGLDETLAPSAHAAPVGATLATIGPAATMRPPSKLVPPRTRNVAEAGPFGRYVLDSQLGSGAMGVVWRAHDPKLGRMIALKLLRRYDPALMDRLVREAQSMAQVSHPNVVGVFDVGITEGASFIAMELVTGRSLRQWQSEKQRTIPELVTAYVAAGRGLAAAHGAGIIHRDFKPDNVLVGDDGRIRVTDFGLAAARPNEGGQGNVRISDVRLTEAGSVLGTPAYMAPEQFQGGIVDPRTDQFNFCAALYEALYGERPFEGSTFDELSDHVIAGTLRPAPAGSQVSRGLRAILARGLAARPAERFPSMEQLLDELARDRARPWKRGTYVALAAAAALALGLVADFQVRDRVAAEISQSFALTGHQVDKTISRLRAEFERASKIAYAEPALREVAAHHDQADFGLGTPEADAEDLEKLHGTLASMEWNGALTADRAVIDYKGRLLYTSYAPQVWNTDMRAIPAVKRALDTGAGSELAIASYTDPMFAQGQVFGSSPPKGLVVMHLRTLALGNNSNGGNETRAIVLQFDNVDDVLDRLQLDQKTLLSIVAPNNEAAGAVPESLIRAAEAGDKLHAGYALLELPIVDEAGGAGRGSAAGWQRGVVDEAGGAGRTRQLGTVVMARRTDAMLTLFPGARLLFVLALFASLGIAMFTSLQARKITGARAA